jgi:hypothetical protein
MKQKQAVVEEERKRLAEERQKCHELQMKYQRKGSNQNKQDGQLSSLGTYKFGMNSMVQSPQTQSIGSPLPEETPDIRNKSIMANSFMTSNNGSNHLDRKTPSHH